MSAVFDSLFVANRGEIAVRIARSAAELGVRTVGAFSPDDAGSLHRVVVDEAVALERPGARGFLDAEALVTLAVEHSCDALHPGYGFLSEQAELAQRCADVGIVFVGPTPEVLALCGDKAASRGAALAAGVPVLAGTEGPVDVAAAEEFVERHGPSMLKAVAGGGGRGLRVVRTPGEVAEAHARARSEADAAFGDGAVFVERLVERPRHVEVQILGDHAGAVVAVGDRECSLQRRHQKIVEIAPAPGLSAATAEALAGHAAAVASHVGYRNAGTFEFLLEADAAGEADGGPAIWFIEANARLQVEHTVTEEITGLDLVACQLRLAAGQTLDDIGLAEPPTPRGMAVQLRVNTEVMEADGTVRPTGGRIGPLRWPGGRGVRIDTHATDGMTTSGGFDSLLAKIVVWSESENLADLMARAARALGETHVGGVDTNVALLAALVSHPDVAAGRLHTGVVADNLDALLQAAEDHATSGEPAGVVAGRAGVDIDASDPLAVLGVTTASTALSDAPALDPVPGAEAVTTPLQGTVVEIVVTVGDAVREGQVVAVMESMKMEHEIRAVCGGVVARVDVGVGEAFVADHPLMYVEPADGLDAEAVTSAEVDLDELRPDLADIVQRHELVLDDARPDAVRRRHDAGQRTARENVDHLVDDGTFIEYGPMVVAAQKRRRSMEELLVKSPADGLVTGVGSINGDLFTDPDNRCAVMAYDYTVFAGTQGIKNHAKTDRILQVAREGRMPLVLFGEGGGGRPGDTDGGDFGTWTFTSFAALSGLVPMVGITTGYCFAGNASLLGCCDVIIATEDSNIGMGGPAMVEGGGLGVYRPDEIGPLDVQVPNGVVDVVVADEAEAVEVAKTYLSYFQGRVDDWEEHDQRRMRPIVPENRLRVYEIRDVIEVLADVGSVLELRRGFAPGMVTSLVRIEGRPVGVVANDPRHLGGAIDADGADKGARFMQLCDAYDIPLLFLCDTPGIMVGPDIERSALVRKSSRMFLVGANLTVPCFTILVRKAYGLGCIAMAGASFKNPLATVAWPTGEFGPMGLEGSVKLGFRDVLAAIDDPDERLARYEELVAAEYRRGKADRQATGFAIDDAIDPADSRRWLTGLLASIRPAAARDGKKAAYIDAW